MEQIPENTVVLDNVQRRRINILCKGTYELRLAEGKTYKMGHEFSSPRLNKCISCFPSLCLMCIIRRHEKVYFAFPEETKTQTRRPTRDTTHPPTNTHTHKHTHIHRHITQRHVFDVFEDHLYQKCMVFVICFI